MAPPAAETRGGSAPAEDPHPREAFRKRYPPAFGNGVFPCSLGVLCGLQTPPFRWWVAGSTPIIPGSLSSLPSQPCLCPVCRGNDVFTPWPPSEVEGAGRCWKAPAPLSFSFQPVPISPLCKNERLFFCKNLNTCSNSSLVILLMLHTSLNSPKHKEV